MFSLVFALLITSGGWIRQNPEFSAKCWFNESARVHHDDNREPLLYFFRVADRPEPALLSRLNRIARGSRFTVIGLSPDKTADVERFIKRERIRFTVGAESTSADGFGVRDFPAMRLIRRGSQTSEPIQVASLDAACGPWGEYGRENLDTIEDPDELKAFIESDSYGLNRQRALFKLFEAIDTREFLAFVEELPEDRDPWVRNGVALLTSRAKGVPNNQPLIAPSSEAQRAYEGSPAAPEWSRARSYLQKLESKSVEQLRQDYHSHKTTDANHLLIRRGIVQRLEAIADRKAARALYMEILADEPDHFIRLRIVGGLNTICPIGDSEVADFLEAGAELEPNLRHVRPFMEYTSEYLRTGQDDTRLFSPRTKPAASP